jgi:hypothetical protein
VKTGPLDRAPSSCAARLPPPGVGYPTGMHVGECNLVMTAAAFAVAGAGAGTRSLDGAFGLDVAGAGWGVGALLVGVLGGAAAVLTGRLYSVRRDARNHPRSTARSA